MGTMKKDLFLSKSWYNDITNSIDNIVDVVVFRGEGEERTFIYVYKHKKTNDFIYLKNFFIKKIPREELLSSISSNIYYSIEEYNNNMKSGLFYDSVLAYQLQLRVQKNMLNLKELKISTFHKMILELKEKDSGILKVSKWIWKRKSGIFKKLDDINFMKEYEDYNKRMSIISKKV